jgi:glycogen operon protein
MDTMSPNQFLPGRPWPLGATLVPEGVNFAVFSAHASAIELCLYDAAGANEVARLALPAHTDGVWHGLLPGAGPGLVYGLRAHGPSDAARGHRFNPAKLLLDPYARRLAGRWRWTEAHLGDVHATDDPHTAQDNARDMLKAVVADEAFDWQGDAPPRIPLSDTVLYEIHVKGFTCRHPDIPAAERGRFAGLAAAPAIAHLTRLGVTAVNLLPVQQHIPEYALARRGATNYWGYNTLAFFVPDARFAQTDPVREFKAMVRALHAAGIEVVLDVVFNHTAETDQRGPTLSWRGLDNAVWYRLRHEDARFYENYSGTGNSLDVSQPRVLQFVLDVLRYWVTEMHVDGFRFDLAASLARGPQGFDARHAFLQAVAQEPSLRGVKLIAEPWDAGPGGYQLGRFPAGWSEWNDRYRDAVRAFWVRKAADRGEFASRLAGSSDLFNHAGRTAVSSVNFVTAHDGFTLRDVVTYDRKHNEANGRTTATAATAT